ncbi:MAG TPA: hypothetical protein DIW31_09160 [Bacteroidales bacterium]|nr:hypothetical protein [Bacteroidales bacterium]
MSALKNLLKTIAANKEFIVIYLLLYTTYIIILPKDGHGADTFCWKEWTKYLFSNGLGNAYKSWTDYLPLYQYFLWVFGYFQGSIEKIEQNIYLLKMITIAFEFVGGFYLIKFLKEKIDNRYELIVYSMFYFLNIAIFYNSVIWGQIDGILSTFLFISFYYALKEKITLSLVFLLLAINLKLQAIIFIPVLGLMLLPLMIKRFSLKNLSLWAGSVLIIQLLILLPFIIKDDISRVLSVIVGSFGKYPVISMNAYNFWFWFFKGSLMQIPDSTKYLGVTCKHWGLIIFFLTSFVALFPLIKMAYLKIVKRSEEFISVEKILLISSLIPLLFFFFNTQMHERYSHPALIFIIAYSIISKNFFPSAIICLAYLLNMEDVLRYLHLEWYNSFIFKRHLVAIIYSIGIISIYIKLYDIRLNLKLSS